jgi:hypothetical protein
MGRQYAHMGSRGLYVPTTNNDGDKIDELRLRVDMRVPDDEFLNAILRLVASSIYSSLQTSVMLSNHGLSCLLERPRAVPLADS